MKTGLNFYTTSIINSANQFEQLTEDNNKLRVNGMEFCKEWFAQYIEAAGKEPTMEKKSVNLTNALTGKADEYYRIDMYVTFEGAESFIGSNPRSYIKGIPFWVEFNGASTVAKIKKAIDKTKAFVVDTPMINVTFEDDEDTKKLTFEATQEYVRIKDIKVLKFDNESEYSTPVTAEVTTNAKGENGFGTYSYLIKNATLPTAANTAWNSKTTMPVVGGIYDQFVIEYHAPAANGSMQHVGGRAESETFHTFWVLQSLSETFKGYLDDLKAQGNDLGE